MSKFKIAFKGKIKDGKFTFIDEDSYKTFIKRQKDGPVYVVIERPRLKRSTEQNNLYWMYLRLIEDETGNDSKKLHLIFKEKFLPKKYYEALGLTVQKSKSTTELSKEEFSDYLDKIERLTDIPVPDTEGYKIGE